ncbi:YciI family protein [Streptomyces sp. NPDC045431]|uniref:YciI family protein n=1 Tax=Streptomyces sp. NPDC045431 TaxID=3155613 RepID=UPI0034011D3A
MKYLVMVQGSQADYEAMNGDASERYPAWTEDDVQTMFAFMEKLNEALVRSGEMLDGQGLAEPARTRFVTAGADGRPVVSDAPYDRTETLIAGYWVLDCDSLDRVTEIAARIAQCPVPEGSPDYPVVIRPILESGRDI